MKIKKMLSRHRRDFTATLECEHCGAEDALTSGYDDDNYHRNVIPKFTCPKCGKKADGTYKPQETKYPAGKVV